MIIQKAKTTKQIRIAVKKVFLVYANLLPNEKRAKIFIKVNANSDMIGLTGNTTDLRLVVAVIEFLQSNGYNNIFVGDGTSSGFINVGIDNLKRLSIKTIGKMLKVSIVDLNKEPGEEIEVLHGYRLKIAKICSEAELFIDLPKLKTHGETKMSCCLKSKIGCVVGLDKQIVHRDLAGNILELNRFVKPHLHIVDSILPMEGLGPSRGIPKDMELIIAGTDPLLLDLAACFIMGRKEEEIPYLLLAREKGLITSTMREKLKKFNFGKYRNVFSYPNPNSLQKLINHPFYRLFFVKIRYAPTFYKLFLSGVLSKLMYFIGARQDFFIKEDALIKNIRIDVKKADKFRLNNYCPFGLDVVNQVNSEKCCLCLYCYFVDRDNALNIEGEIGHLGYQINHYKKVIEKVAP